MAVGPAKPLTHESPILIVGGAGTIGCSTALHLRRRGYTNITLIDAYPFPDRGYGNSQSAGGCDINKIVGMSQTAGTRGQLSEMIMQGWRTDPVFSPYYHEVGELVLASLPETIAHYQAAYQRRKRDFPKDTTEWLDNEAEIRARAPHLRPEQIQNWKGIYEPGGGWGAAMDAIDSVGAELKRLGSVKMVFGPSGTFAKPLIDSSSGRCIGAEAKDGTQYTAERVVMATGAWTPSLVDLEGQCISKCWIVAHLELSDEEAQRYASIPVVYNDEVGFCFEPRYIPNPTTGHSRWIIKLCDEFAGYTRYLKVKPFGAQHDETISVPRSHSDHPTDTVPDEGEKRLRRVVEVMLPEFKDRPFVKTYCCWCTDTEDADWLFCQHPKYPGLFIASGDSGHSFTTLPIVGGQVADLLEGKMSDARMKSVGWRPGAGDPHHTGRGGPEPKDLSKLPGWAHADDPGDV